MKKLRKIGTLLVLALALNLVSAPEVSAQCPMCKMSAESNLKNGGTAGKGLNFGILYMLSLPYVLVAGLGYMWYRNRRKEDEVVPEPEVFSTN
ncbi:MAG: hypothetical protein D6714_02225 [Bacteroidetes bacterium]|nr:MAG: hypothetical protein D6714_02225 [Bacteroidota bacterium]